MELVYGSENGQRLIKSFSREGKMTGPLLAWIEGERVTGHEL